MLTKLCGTGTSHVTQVVRGANSNASHSHMRHVVASNAAMVLAAMTETGIVSTDDSSSCTDHTVPATCIQSGGFTKTGA